MPHPPSTVTHPPPLRSSSAVGGRSFAVISILHSTVASISRGKRVRGHSSCPFLALQVLGYFFVCLWMIPFSVFISLSANDMVLPTIGGPDGAGDLGEAMGLFT